MVEFTPNFNFKIPDFNQRFWHDDMRRLLNGFDVLIAKYAALGNVIGVWDNSTAYAVGEVLIDENVGAIYECNTAHTSSATGTFQDDRDLYPFYWINATITNRFIGPWVSNYPYKTGDFVVSGNKYAVATQPFTSGATYTDDEAAGRFYTLIDVPAVPHPQLPTPVPGTALYYARQNAAGNAYEVIPPPAAIVTFDDPNIYASVVGGTANSIQLSLPVPLTSYQSGRVIRFLAALTNTSAVTVDIDGLGVKTVQRNAVALASSLIVAGRWYELLYDGTNFQMRRFADITQIVSSDATTIWGATTGGSANAQTLTPSIAITAYAAGQIFRFIPSFSNTGAATLAVSGLAAIPIRKNQVALVNADMPAGRVFEVIYDGTNFNLRQWNDFDIAILNESGTPPDVVNDFVPMFNAATSTIVKHRPYKFVRRFGLVLTVSPYVLSTNSLQNHGLGYIPSGIHVFLECISAEHNYSVGDRIQVSGDAPGSSTASFTVHSNSATFGITTTAVAPCLINKTSFAYANITPAKWKAIVYAYGDIAAP